MSLTLMSIGGKQLLFYTLILKIVEYLYATFKGTGKIHNDLLTICLAYYLVLTSVTAGVRVVKMHTWGEGGSEHDQKYTFCMQV